jgi:hypothetical protein
MNRRNFIGLGAALAGSAGLLIAQPGKWDYLGECNLDGGSDHDRIRVGGGRGSFRRIQLRVERAAVDFDRVVVHFENGSRVPVQVSNIIRAGGRTREIDLPGDKRQIDSVEIWYKRANWGAGGKPKIRLYGIRW